MDVGAERHRRDDISASSDILTVNVDQVIRMLDDGLVHPGGFTVNLTELDLEHGTYGPI
jgi:hypothetical protein